MKAADINIARRGRKIKEVTSEVAIARLVDIFANCYLAKGQKREAADLVVMASTVYNQLSREYSGFTLEEIELASNEAVYSGTKYISPADMIQWIRDYRSSEVYREAREQEDYNPFQIEEFKGPNLTEDQAAANLLRADYDYLVQHREFPKGRFGYPRGMYCYDYLVKRGKLNKEDFKNYRVEGRRLLGLRNMYDESLTPKQEEIYSKVACVDAYLMRMAKKEWAREAIGDLPE